MLRINLFSKIKIQFFTFRTLSRDQVTTPVGTTIRGLMVMEAKSVKSALIETIEASYKRAVEIGNEIDKSIRNNSK